MRYRAISADGHVNEPPTLFVDNLPEKFKERGPRVIETPNTKGHAWIMEDQSRPSVLGFSSIFFKSAKKFERATLIEDFKQIKDRGVRYDDFFPGSYDAKARVEEMIEGETDAEVIFNGVGTIWNGIKLMKDKELALARFKVYNDWMADFQAYDPARLICNATLPTTGIDDCIAELRRAHEMGLRTAQLEAYPSGSFTDPSPEDDRFWAAAVELDMPINIHKQFFFPAGDLGSKVNAEGVPDTDRRAKTLGIDIAAGEYPMVLFNVIRTGVFERFSDLRLIGTESYAGWVPYYLERFDESVRRNRKDWNLPLLPSEYFHRNALVVYIIDQLGLLERYDIGIANIMWGPDFPHSTSSWPVDFELGLEYLRAAGATPSEIERIMWRTAADLYKLPYEEPDAVEVAA